MPYLVVHFTNDNSYTVINDINNKLKSVSKATVNIDEKWQTGIILYIELKLKHCVRNGLETLKN